MNSVYDDVKKNCFGCEICETVCPYSAITMVEDEEGFRYPKINLNLCVDCGLCKRVCPCINLPQKNQQPPYVFGGYHKNNTIKNKSTSGGVFSAIVEEFCDENYVIFGAATKGLRVYHTFTQNKKNIDKFRKSKYVQSSMDACYKKAAQFLKDGKKVLFSGTPCQIAALENYIKSEALKKNLLTVEVVCEGFPSPILLRKYTALLEKRYHSSVKELDYRYKDKNRWDFEVMKITFSNNKIIKQDRWFNPFWIFWSERLMSRPSCEECPFRTTDRVADITLGDLWGVHKYCPELYGNNGGSSLVVCNSEKGKQLFAKAKKHIYGHQLLYEDALQYQRPMRVIVPANEKRDLFMRDLERLDYKALCKKWKPKSSIKVLFSKYIWGSNRQVVNLWKIKTHLQRRKNEKFK